MRIEFNTNSSPRNPAAITRATTGSAASAVRLGSPADARAAMQLS